MSDQKNSPTNERKIISLSEDSISRFLDKGDLEPREILVTHGLDKSSRTNLSNILRTMQDKGIVVKIGGKFHKIPISQSELEEQVEKILVQDDCSLKNIDIIKQKFNQKFTENISEKTLSKILQTLCNQNKIYEHKKEFRISNSELNKHNRCYLCKKEFNDNQLIISAIISDDDGMINNYQLHALCRNNLDENDRIFYNTSSANCDYCGLSLSVQMLLFNKIEEINLDKEIDTLFNEPFSKIFSSIDSTKHGDEGMNIRSFACNKTENGKQYHPYCFDIIQESKKGSKK
jgi:hypothetical protein